MKPKYFFLLLALAVIVLGCTAKTAKNGDNVSVLYSVQDEMGTLIDNNNNNPLIFTIGSGQVIPGFNYAVLGMHIGESKRVVVPPEEAYGEHMPEKVISVALEELEKNEVDPVVGHVIYTVLNNRRLEGVITDVNSTHALIDFNPALAGKTLTFDIQLVKINK